jgi:hypothetical protein
VIEVMGSLILGLLCLIVKIIQWKRQWEHDVGLGMQDEYGMNLR